VCGRRRYLDSTPEAHRPSGVVFVDLDNDVLHLGVDEDLGSPRQKPRLPDREAHKLRQKLMVRHTCASTFHYRSMQTT
jgi:DENN domain-containing protein 5